MREKDVILKVKPSVWDKLTPFQKGLWVVDETEERWLQLKAKYPKIKYVEVYFESEKGLSEYTFEKAHERVAKVLGLRSKKVISKVNPHAGNAKSAKQLQDQKEKRKELRDQSIEYMKRTNYFPDWGYLPRTYNSFDDPIDNL
jgi:hypothetical protein